MCRQSHFFMSREACEPRTGFRRSLQGTAVAACLLQLAGCMSPAQKFDRLAQRSGLEMTAIAGDGFEHRIYRTPAMPQSGGLLFVYIEGDGQPGAHGGQQPATDPTAAKPLALQLMTSSSRAGIYLTRPCYNGLNLSAGCTNQHWTSARYSEAVVASLGAALDRYLAALPEVEVVLVGFSGGGTLAMLMAPRVRNLRGVVTVAANLDIDAWTSLHGYLPLRESLNPARLPEPPVPVVHFVGGRDTNAPPSLFAAYFSQHPSGTVLHMPEFDHSCCWVGQWPTLLDAALAALTKAGARHPIAAGP